MNTRLIITICLLAIGLTLASCAKFLDEKSNKSIVVPSSIRDLQALLDATRILNVGSTISLFEVATDDYWLTEASYNGLTNFQKDNYLWKPNPLYLRPDMAAHWSLNYIVILYSNTIIEELGRIKGDQQELDRIRGSALFFRSFSFFDLAQAYAPLYMDDTQTLPAIPIRLDPDFNIKTERANVGTAYRQILNDLKLSIDFLPIVTKYPTQPTKAAAYALLSRIHLSLSQYDLALDYALKAIALHDTLIDYNTLDVNASIPFKIFNAETIFFAYSSSSAILDPSRANINPSLIARYMPTDLRKKAFYREQTPGIWAFKGGYHGMTNGTYFVGLTTNELYLTIAECYAREGNIEGSLQALNHLLINRFEQGTYHDFITTDKNALLHKVIDERRKELVMRGLRWRDIRRLNKDPNFAYELKRWSSDSIYDTRGSLPPNDKRYIFLIPQEVIELTNIAQNER